MSNLEDWTFQSNGQTLISPTNRRLQFVKEANGRGQLTAAAFYRDEETQESFFIKRDPLGTCLAEASCTHEFLPTEQQQSSCCAQIGLVDGKVVSIQPAITRPHNMSLVELDTWVYGAKRKAQTLVSSEAFYWQTIRKFLQNLTPNARQDLALGLLVSTANGDESVHLGQFVAIVENQKIVSIKRVDFGARERFAVHRWETNDLLPGKTSDAYASSGQLGKQYIDFLVADPKLKSNFLSMWAQADTEKMVACQMHKLETQFANIPAEYRTQALNEFLESMNKKAEHPIQVAHLPLDEQVPHFMNLYSQLITWRCETMKQEARREIKILVNSKQLKLKDEQRLDLLRFFYGKGDANTITAVQAIRDELAGFKSLFYFRKKASYRQMIQFIDAELERRHYNATQVKQAEEMSADVKTKTLSSTATIFQHPEYLGNGRPLSTSPTSEMDLTDCNSFEEEEITSVETFSEEEDENKPNNIFN